MEEVITSILAAEQKADEIIKNAADDAKNILIYSENSADEIREKAVADFKVRRKAAIEKAEQNAEKQYLEKVEQGEKQAAELIRSVESKKNAAATSILSKIVG